LNSKRLLLLADFLEGVGRYKGKGIPVAKFDLSVWMADSRLSRNRAAMKTRRVRKFPDAFKLVSKKAFYLNNEDSYFERGRRVFAEPVHCQTAGCACGWAATIPAFKRAGFRLAVRANGLAGDFKATVTYRGFGGMAAVCLFFDIPQTIADALFLTTAYRDATPKMVGERIRLIVEAHERGGPTRALEAAREAAIASGAVYGRLIAT
jgi:hypothetical protein